MISLLYMMGNMTTNSPNFLPAPISNSNERALFSECPIFIPKKTGLPSLGHVYYDPRGGLYAGGSNFTARKAAQKGPQSWGETHTQKKDEGVVVSERLPQCIFMLAELTHVGFQRYLKQKTTQRRIDSQWVNLCYWLEHWETHRSHMTTGPPSFVRVQPVGGSCGTSQICFWF